MLYSLWNTPIAVSDGVPTGGAGHKLGELFLTKFVLPFEIVSILLLAALISALVIAKKDGAFLKNSPSNVNEPQKREKVTP
jgi:NADH-quinone oxidoreductase subunit J